MGRFKLGRAPACEANDRLTLVGDDVADRGSVAHALSALSPSV